MGFVPDLKVFDAVWFGFQRGDGLAHELFPVGDLIVRHEPLAHPPGAHLALFDQDSLRSAVDRLLVVTGHVEIAVGTAVHGVDAPAQFELLFRDAVGGPAVPVVEDRQELHAFGFRRQNPLTVFFEVGVVPLAALRLEALP